MAVLRAMDGKFYDVPDDQAAKYELPREKVKELLEKSGGPGPRGAGGPPPGYGGPPGAGGGQVVVQIFAGSGQSGGSDGPGGPPGGPGGPPPGGGGGEGDVDPYWWWRNFVPSWGNYWPNY